MSSTADSHSRGCAASYSHHAPRITLTLIITPATPPKRAHAPLHKLPLTPQIHALKIDTLPQLVHNTRPAAIPHWSIHRGRSPQPPPFRINPARPQLPPFLTSIQIQTQLSSIPRAARSSTAPFHRLIQLLARAPTHTAAPRRRPPSPFNSNLPTPRKPLPVRTSHVTGPRPPGRHAARLHTPDPTNGCTKLYAARPPRAALCCYRAPPTHSDRVSPAPLHALTALPAPRYAFTLMLPCASIRLPIMAPVHSA